MVNQQLINYAEEIIDIFRLLSKILKGHITKEADDLGFTVPQIMLMNILSEHPGISLNELSKRLSLSKSTVSGIVDRLEKNGNLIREIPEENRRTVKIFLSENCPDFKRVRDIKTQHLSKILEELGIEETEKFLISFNKLKEAIISYEKDFLK
ncbi:MarR family transcriptional regulator [Clostridium sp. A1-XYC3]|uniref:MarR family transcriptional regulator n=1 Tax=Clostridium tanneri TaxID=3037988 RepID=A0ABU4JSA5_9CLOT|nr:MarR family transcriptional regulator [Clostridium sp. A1-XYC3]MDW8800986.1 MarR family transcriptional regulator [Clostridium sp. A1-XYC3]